MPDKYTYLLVDALTLAGPLALSFDKKVAFYKSWKGVLLGILLVMMVFIPWDIYFTSIGVWTFNPRYLIGIYLLGLPIEEWLFFVVVPYACTFVYACVRRYFRQHLVKQWGRYFALLLGPTLIFIGLANLDKYYTASALTLAGLGAIFLATKGKNWATGFFVSYLICLIPFMIVNGILTSLPVVIYNNLHNLGIRIYTIPIEDTFYGLVMILLGIVGYRLYPDQDRIEDAI